MGRARAAAGLTIAALLTAGFSSVSQRQMAISPAGPTYAGPGDVVTFDMWWGLRAYSAAKAAATGNAIRIRRASDDTETNITSLTTGALDVATAGTFCNATTCFIKTWYDQSAGAKCGAAACDLTQAVSVLQAQLIFSCIGSLPCARFPALAYYNQSGTRPAAQAQPISGSFVANRTSVDPVDHQVLFAPGGVFSAATVYWQFNVANNLRIFAGGAISATVSDAAWHTIQTIFNGASSIINADGSDVATGDPGAAGGANFELSLSAAGTLAFKGDMAEAGWKYSAFSGANNTAIDANQSAYWGI